MPTAMYCRSSVLGIPQRLKNSKEVGRFGVSDPTRAAHEWFPCPKNFNRVSLSGINTEQEKSRVFSSNDHFCEG